MITGGQGGIFQYFQNTGTGLAPTFTELTGGGNPLNGVFTTFDSSVSAGDLDGDGDLDAIVGQQNGTFRFFENTGTATSPTFTEMTGGSNPLNGVDVGVRSSSSLGDLDGDGDLDLFAGDADGVFRFFLNTGSATGATFTQQTGANNPLDGLDVGTESALSLGDIDRDGDLDAVIGSFYGTFRVFENTGTALAPTFTELT